MSWDVSFRIDVGAGNQREAEDAGNMTYNVSPMYYEALGGDGLRGLDGRLAWDALPDLERAVADMEARPATYRTMNPQNGWGDYESALNYLRRIRDIARECPATTISVR